MRVDADAASSTAQYHDRMPVVLDESQFDDWMRGTPDGYTYSENALTGQRSCHWTGSVWGHIDYKFMRSGDISYGPFGREVY